MLYQVGQGQKYTTLDGLPATKGDTVQLVSDILDAKTYDIQTGMNFDGQGHTITVTNPKAHAINFAKWCMNARAFNFHANTGPLTSAAQVSSR